MCYMFSTYKTYFYKPYDSSLGFNCFYLYTFASFMVNKIY